jgi:hypothetical protein
LGTDVGRAVAGGCEGGAAFEAGWRKTDPLTPARPLSPQPPPGACAKFIPSSSCKDVDAGEGKVAECISQLIASAEAAGTGEDAGGSGGAQGGCVRMRRVLCFAAGAGCCLAAWVVPLQPRLPRNCDSRLSRLTFQPGLPPVRPRPPELVPDKCEAEVYDFFIKRSKNINANVPLGERGANGLGRAGLGRTKAGAAWWRLGGEGLLESWCRFFTHALAAPAAPIPSRCRPAAKACKGDAVKHCNNTWFFGHTQGRVIACLK